MHNDSIMRLFDDLDEIVSKESVNADRTVRLYQKS